MRSNVGSDRIPINTHVQLNERNKDTIENILKLRNMVSGPVKFLQKDRKHYICHLTEKEQEYFDEHLERAMHHVSCIEMLLEKCAESSVEIK